MPRLHPLHAVRYASDDGLDSVSFDLSSKIAPPYDVLDEGPKAALLEKDGDNIVAVDLPVTPPKTVGPDEAYAAAGELYRRWLSDGVLTRDDRPGVVVYEQAYELEGQTVRRRGLFAGLGVEEFNQPNGIFRHEMTIAGGIGDRTKLMEATKAQLSPIFGIYPDPRKQAVAILNEVCESREPDYHGTTANDGVAHRCWAVHDEATLATLSEFFAQTEVFIADGHHRYTTALQFSKEYPELPGAGSCLFVLVAAEDPGMIVLPTHRVVCGLQEFVWSELEAVLKADGRCTLGGDPSTARFGLYDPVSGNTIGLDTTDDVLAEAFGDKPEVWRSLDVAVLHEWLIQRVLRPNFGGANDGGIGFKYTADVEEMMRLAAEPDPAGARIGVVMRGTPLESVMAVSRADEVMPPKSTYFYPKLATGLVISPLD
ncbi:MAG: DUF1015 domain-containing protein [Planctomycetota bacterium]